MGKSRSKKRDNHQQSQKKQTQKQKQKQKPVAHKGRRNNRRRSKHPRPSQQQQQQQYEPATSSRPGSSALSPVRVSRNSIHSQWKQELGGIIRYYIHQRSNLHHHNINTTKRDAEHEVERMYYSSGCSIPRTKEAILAALGVTKEVQDDWIQMSMAVELHSLDTNLQKILTKGDATSSNSDNSHHPLEPSVDNQGLQLRKIQQAGEGPAHSHQLWNTVVVPPWAIHKPFFFQIHNRSGIHLSCEVTLDGHKVAKNVPIPSSSIRTVRPDATRYFHLHKWVFQPAKRITLQQISSMEKEDSNGNENGRVKAESGAGAPRAGSSQQPPVPPRPPPKPRTKRYNGIRPTYHPAHPRVSLEDYPEPTAFGWKFTGSVEESLVEFYELPLNMGSARMDFYYTTATVKTVLVHPSTGINALYRNTVSGEDFVKILSNPRVHTNRGYRRRVDRPPNLDVAMEDEDKNDFDKVADDAQQDTEMDVQNALLNDSTGAPDAAAAVPAAQATFYAKDENYNFKIQGHSNRRVEMSKLHSSREFSKWEEAAKKEWAVVHAKFYISLPKAQRRWQGPQNRILKRQRQRKRNKEALERLPTQAEVIDVKAAERATLGTKFLATGKNMHQPARRSAVRMERIKGLTDENEWKGGPLFETKLYYRSEDILSGNGNADVDLISDDELENGDERMNGEQLSKQSVASKLLQEIPLDAYKAEKINQVKQYHVENISARPDEAEDMLKNCQTKIKLCHSVDDVDELVKIYYGHVVKGQFYESIDVPTFTMENV